MEHGERKQRALLGVFAHPDDESYGPGGMLARYALEGAEVRVLFFTCGEAGTIGVSKDLPREELCRRRRIEAARASEALGLAGHRILGLPDRRLSETPDEEGIGLVLEEIRAHRPQVVVTFHRLGISGHPDHVAVTRFTREAFSRAAAEGPLKLYEWAIPQSKAPLYRERRLIPVPDEEIGAVIAVPPEAMDRKLEAIRRHETQIEFYHELVRIFGDFREATAEECFVLSDTRLTRPTERESDLFLGIPAE
ncbi:MAG: PIG-L deacetylase family protein [Candidatus Eisenbacteria bacterium]